MIDTPPFLGYALRPGITFTYLGLEVDQTCGVRFGGRPSPNLFVAGEMMAGPTGVVSLYCFELPENAQP